MASRVPCNPGIATHIIISSEPPRVAITCLCLYDFRSQMLRLCRRRTTHLGSCPMTTKHGTSTTLRRRLLRWTQSQKTRPQDQPRLKYLHNSLTKVMSSSTPSSPTMLIFVCPILILELNMPAAQKERLSVNEKEKGNEVFGHVTCM